MNHAVSTLCDSLTAELGSPTRQTTDPVIETAWELPEVVICLSPLTGAVDLVFKNPLNQQWLDQLSM